MLEGINIILERMKTHPEDFVSPTIQSSRWLKLYEMALSEDIAMADEVLALHQGMKDARRALFNEKVLKQLAGVIPDHDDVEAYMHTQYTQHLANSMKATKLMVSQKILDEFDKAYGSWSSELAGQQLTKQESRKESMKQLLNMKKKNGGRYA